MKRLLFMFSFVGILFVGCENKNEPIVNGNEEVTAYFIYNIPTDKGGSMTKTTDAEVFDEFYKKIVSAELVAENYELLLTETTTNAKYEFKGAWNGHDMVTLRTGTYHVVGKSTASGDNIQEKCSFVFDEFVEISASTSTITLSAKYDCSLLVFSSNDISSLFNYNGEETTSMFSFKEYKYAFVNDKLFNQGKEQEAYIGGEFSDGAEFKCYTGNLTFEKGKYYIYSSITGGFIVPEMEPGGTDNHEYSKTQYIELKGTYFRSGVVHGDNPKVYADFELISLRSGSFVDDGNNYLFGAFTPSYWSEGSVGFNIHTGRENFTYYIGGVYDDYAGEYKLNNRYRLTLDNSTCIIQDIVTSNQFSYDFSANTTSITEDFTIGGLNNILDTASYGTGHDFVIPDFKLYEFIIYEDDVEVAHYIPCKDNSTEYGVLYDTVSQKYLYADNPSLVIAGSE